MSPSQLERWLAQTRDLRAYVESEQWQRTKEWLREFLRVQNIYSEAEIQQLRNEIVRADAEQMLAILKRIQSKHDSMLWMQQAAESSRQIALANREMDVAQQQAARAAAQSQTRTAPLFGTGLAGAQRGNRNRSGYQVPGPLITSREVARASVWAQTWGPVWYIGGF
jgi:hypothetical protein